MMSKPFTFFCAAFLLVQSMLPCNAETLSGAGSSAAAPVYRAWATIYARSHDFQLSYDPVGSSAGLGKIKAKEVSFGASDVAPSEQAMTKDGLVLVPTFISGVVPVVNVPKIGSAKLRLSGEVLAAIFLGEITRWNAPEIRSLNGGLPLPDLPIKPVVRSDGSGTTYYFTDYLSKISPGWKGKFGAQSSVTWPEQFVSVKGSDGMARAVKDNAGSIGYIDFDYVAASGLNAVQLRNASNEFVDPGAESFRAAMRASAWFTSGDFHASLANLPGPNAWPIMMGTFVLLPKVSDKPAETLAALQFFMWALLKGNHVVEGMHFVPLPNNLQALASGALSSVTDRQGRKLGLEAMGILAKP